jgi:putative DNA primase/helicase
VTALDAIHDFIRAMESDGIRPIEDIAGRLISGEIIRFRCEGDGRGRQNGWAILYLDERPAGAYGHYRLGISDRKWKLGEAYAPLSREEREALQREWEEAKAKRQAERDRSAEEAAIEALEIWGRASPASDAHPYAARKRLDPSPLRELDGKLLIPMVDAQGKLWNLQRIAGDGTKRFLKGGRTDGLFCLVGYATTDADTFCIGEGYATMAAVHRASGRPCIVCFSSKNMLTVARIWNSARPDLHYIVCADDDEDNPQGNVGLTAAKAVAEEIGAKLALPRVCASAEAA